MIVVVTYPRANIVFSWNELLAQFLVGFNQDARDLLLGNIPRIILIEHLK
jgi:hypothetical protein